MQVRPVAWAACKRPGQLVGMDTASARTLRHPPCPLRGRVLGGVCCLVLRQRGDHKASNCPRTRGQGRRRPDASTTSAAHTGRLVSTPMLNTPYNANALAHRAAHAVSVRRDRRRVVQAVGAAARRERSCMVTPHRRRIARLVVSRVMGMLHVASAVAAARWLVGLRGVRVWVRSDPWVVRCADRARLVASSVLVHAGHVGDATRGVWPAHVADSVLCLACCQPALSRRACQGVQLSRVACIVYTRIRVRG